LWFAAAVAGSTILVGIKPVPLVGPSNKGIHVKADSQRSINLFPHKIEREGEKARWHLIGTPGLSLHCTLPKSPIRGLYVFSERLFAVAGSSIYEVYDSGSYHLWGTIPSNEGRVSIAELTGIIVIGDGSAFYALDVTTGLLTTITAAPIGRICLAFNSRILYIERDSGRVYYSELNDPTNVPSLNFFSAENRPDDIVTAVPTEDQIWLLGTGSVEPWYDSGDNANPFNRIQGGVVHSGLLAADTALRLDNSVFWVEQDAQGKGIVRRSVNFTPQRISTEAVERFTSSANNLTAYSYQEQGHTFYVLNADEGTWSYDIATQEWHERAYLNQITLERARPEIHAYAYGQHFVSDYQNGKVYRAGLDLYDDAGTAIVRRRITAHMDFGPDPVSIYELYIDIASGVGLSVGQGSDPKLMLRYSTDGGQRWSNELWAPIGKIGETDEQVQFFMLGYGRDWVFEVSVSDPVKVVMLGARAMVG
jgi:hypothetical protein